MHNLLRKERKLCASCLSYLFIPFGLMFLVPGYPVLCGAFFVTLGLFQSFQNARETNDILFSALLPIAKKDVVRAKYRFVCRIEGYALLLMGLSAALRATIFADAAVYKANALMNANGFALGLAFLLFALFNAVFVGGFFRTAYRLGRPFALYIAAAFPVILAGEAAHHFPGLEELNAFGTHALPLQLALAAAGALSYGLITWFSCRSACAHFEKLDL